MGHRIDNLPADPPSCRIDSTANAASCLHPMRRGTIADGVPTVPKPQASVHVDSLARDLAKSEKQARYQRLPSYRLGPVERPRTGDWKSMRLRRDCTVEAILSGRVCANLRSRRGPRGSQQQVVVGTVTASQRAAAAINAIANENSSGSRWSCGEDRTSIRSKCSSTSHWVG